MAFDEFGVTCANCGKFTPIFTPALPTMSDPFSATCPYCKSAASYEKSAVKYSRWHKLGAANRAQTVAAIMVACLLFVLLIWSIK
jgi:hypothetical protein